MTFYQLQDAKRAANQRARNDLDKWPDSQSRRDDLRAIDARDAKLDDYDRQMKALLKR